MGQQKSTNRKELNLNPAIFAAWQLLRRFVIPIAMGIILI
jgi:hypothetical protein